MHEDESIDEHAYPGHRPPTGALKEVTQPGSAGRYLFHPLRLLLGAVFVIASYDKILHPQAFAEAVYNYQILPDAVINLTALTLPWLELLLGLCMLTGIWLPGATVVCTGLLIVFIGALVFNQIRGLDIHCGCFSTEPTSGPAGLGTVIRDAGFLAAAFYLTMIVFGFQPALRNSLFGYGRSRRK